ncbi:MAG: glycine/sarcosine/betaine reductase component B subunit, partial [Candidatus Nealsonbacteria bacterium]|nr:glycine/sarcosine/betaine reductase component B subunit [Candidatus Nealsonbacteria bacterium]
NGVLYIEGLEFLKKMLDEDKRLKSLCIEIARPGEKKRIIPIKDVIEPRVKIEGKIGEGLTLALKGISVITCGQIVGFQEGLLDMSGPGAEYSSFSKLINIVLTAKVADGLTKQQHEEALRQLGQRAAAYFGQAAKKIQPDEIEEFWELIPRINLPILPNVIYIYMLLSQGLMHDTYVHGKDAKGLLPALLQPSEILDGAIVSGNCVSACDKNTTYHHMNNPIIRELYKMHGKAVNFIGVIITNESTMLAEKEMAAEHAVRLAMCLGAQGVIISKEGFGNPDADLMMICSKLEKFGIKTVCITDEFAGSDGISQSLADAHKAADAVISTGNANEKIILPPMEKTIGDKTIIQQLTGGSPKSLKEDGSLEVELQVILGATNQLGYEKLSVKEI